MKSFLNEHVAISLYTVTFALLVILMSGYMHHSQRELELSLQKNIKTQTESLHALMLLTDSNEANEKINKLISDCTRRTEFEKLLVSLDGATTKEIIATQQLFESCGAFFATRKSLMVSEMEYEYDVLVSNIELLDILRDVDVEKREAENIKKLIDFEKNRSELLSEQVVLQEKIISALLSNEDRGITVYPSVASASEISQSLSVLDKQIDALRTEIIP